MLFSLSFIPRLHLWMPSHSNLFFFLLQINQIQRQLWANEQTNEPIQYSSVVLERIKVFLLKVKRLTMKEKKNILKGIEKWFKSHFSFYFFIFFFHFIFWVWRRRLSYRIHFGFWHFIRWNILILSISRFPTLTLTLSLVLSFFFFFFSFFQYLNESDVIYRYHRFSMFVSVLENQFNFENTILPVQNEKRKKNT